LIFNDDMSRLYSPEHQWIDPSLSPALVGITPHAQETLGDVVFVDLPAVGAVFAAGSVACVVESVKAAADVFMPASGEVVEVNEALRADPSLANSDPLGAGWFFKVKLSQPDELGRLLDEQAYRALLG
jgi:glycine cleavage system H protein